MTFSPGFDSSPAPDSWLKRTIFLSDSGSSLTESASPDSAGLGDVIGDVALTVGGFLAPVEGFFAALAASLAAATLLAAAEGLTGADMGPLREGADAPVFEGPFWGAFDVLLVVSDAAEPVNFEDEGLELVNLDPPVDGTVLVVMGVADTPGFLSRNEEALEVVLLTLVVDSGLLEGPVLLAGVGLEVGFSVVLDAVIGVLDVKGALDEVGLADAGLDASGFVCVEDFATSVFDWGLANGFVWPKEIFFFTSGADFSEVTFGLVPVDVPLAAATLLAAADCFEGVATGP